jgi:hypothetical protein
MLVGCNKVVTHRQIDTSTGVEEKKENSVTGTIKQPDPSSNSPSNSPTSSPTNYVKTYEDETHKEIQYGKLSFNIGLDHIVSHTYSDNIETFKCESDKGKVKPVTHMDITVRAIKKQDFLNKESIISYLSDMSPNYEKIRIYNNVTDDSGIISSYIVTGGGQTKYVVCYRDACYLMESNNSSLDAYIFKKLSIEPNYEAYKQKVKCANSFTAYVNETISYDDNKAEYDIIQSKDGKKYSAELSRHKEYQYHFTLKNEKGENLLTLSTHASDINDVIKILDLNMDGYADVQFLEQAGTMNNSYALYVWDDTAQNFVKVKCDKTLSYFEVHDGYLQNWVKESANSGVIQKFVWDKNTLKKESEEPYHAS